MPKFIAKHPEKGVLTFTLSGERISVGRHSDNDIQIQHGTISAHHAEFVLRNGRYILRDLNSTNHSFVEGIMFMEAEMERPCSLVLGTIECEFLPDNVEAVPEGVDALRKTVGLLRRQNDELVAKIAEQKNQIDILSKVKLITRDTTAQQSGIREQAKSATAERDRLAAENAELVAQVAALHAKLGIPSIAKAAQPAIPAVSSALPQPSVSLGETVIVAPPQAKTNGR